MIDRKVSQILATRRSAAEKIASENIKKINKYPQLSSLYALRQKLIIERSRARVFNEPFDQQKLSNVENEFSAMLKKIGLTLADLSPKYACPNCEDTGLNFGRECDCVKKIISEINVKPLKNLKTFADVNPAVFDNQNMKDIFALMEKYSQKPDPKQVFITFCGATGVGKTFLLECMTSEFLKRGKSLAFRTAFECNQDFLNYHTSSSKNSGFLTEKFLAPEVLLIDDLGSEPFYRNVTVEYLFLVLDQRGRDKKITIISTNLTPEEIKERYGERCFSRIINKQQNLIFNMQNSDIRLKPTTKL